MTGEKLQKLIGGKYFLPVLSFLIALCIWIYVVVYQSDKYGYVHAIRMRVYDNFGSRIYNAKV